jgi:hypothetical protein
MSQGIITCLKTDLFIDLVIFGQNEQIFSKFMRNYKISSCVEFFHTQAIRMHSVNKTC